MAASASLRLLRKTGGRPVRGRRLDDYALGVPAVIGRMCWLTLCCTKKSTGNVDVGRKGASGWRRYVRRHREANGSG